MRLSSLTSGLLLLAMVFISEGHTQLATGGRYSGPTGPEHWGNLTEEFRLCRDGKNQSPTNITAALPAKQPQMDIRYGTGRQHPTSERHHIYAATVSFSFPQREPDQRSVLPNGPASGPCRSHRQSDCTHRTI